MFVANGFLNIAEFEYFLTFSEEYIYINDKKGNKRRLTPSEEEYLSNWCLHRVSNTEYVYEEINNEFDINLNMTEGA
jgi:hypothetical protein